MAKTMYGWVENPLDDWIYPTIERALAEKPDDAVFLYSYEVDFDKGIVLSVKKEEE